MAELLYPRWRIEIDGRPRTLLSGTARLSAAQFVATFNGGLLKSEGVPSPGDQVRVMAGYGATLYPVFAGEIDTNGVTARPNDLEIACSGYLARLADPIGVAPDIVSSASGPVSEPVPVVTYASMAGAAIAADILDRYGVPAYTLDDSGDLFGVVRPIPVFGDDPGQALLQDLDQAEFYRTFDGPDGVVHRLPWARIASASAGRTFTDDQHLYAGRLEQSRTGIRNRVMCFGLPQHGTTGAEFTPTGLAEIDSDLVPTPPGHRAASYNVPLLEVGDRCQAWAETKLGELNRLTQTLPCELVTGDATLWPGMTVAVQSSKLGLSGSERLLIEEVQHDLSASEGFQTSLSLYLTAPGAGYNPNLPPVALITARGMRETLADGTTQREVSLDGSASYDPELGIPGIVSYVWSGSPVTPTAVGAGQRASVVYPGPLPSGASVTLTVTDNLGATGSATLPITDQTVAFVVRDIIAALLTTLETSRDGQRTWVQVKALGVDIPAVGTCEMGGTTYTFAWTAAGKLYKLLTDETATEVTPAGGNITACTIHTDQAGVPDGRVWAGGTAGQCWRSVEHGALGTWVALVPAPNGATVQYIQESFYAAGQLEMLAGRTYYTSFSGGGDWVESYTHPNTGLVARRFAAGFGQGWIGYQGPNNGLDAGAGRLVERAAAVAITPPGATVLSIAGLSLDVSEAIVYVADNDPVGGAGRLWTAGTTASGVLAPHPYNTATWGDVRHMIRDGLLPGLVYMAAQNALLKSANGLTTTVAMRALAGGRQGMMIGYGAAHAIPPPVGALVWIGTTTPPVDNHDPTSGYTFALTAAGFERRAASPLDGHYGQRILLATTDGALLCYSREDSGSAFHPFIPGSYTAPNLYRSTDGGLTWDATPVEKVNLARVSGTTVYASTVSETGLAGAGTLWRSDDSGSSWTLVHDFGVSIICALAVCSGDPDLVVISRPGHTGRLYEISHDGGATFADTAIAMVSAADVGGDGYSHISPDGHWLLHHDTTAGAEPLLRSSLTGGAVRVGVTTPAFVAYAFTEDADGAIYGYGGAFPVIRSTDQGASWTPWYDADRAPAPGMNSAANGARSFVPRDLTNAGYVLPYWGGSGERLSLASQAPTAEPAARWVSLDAALATAFPAADYHAYYDAAVRLPGEEV